MSITNSVRQTRFRVSRCELRLWHFAIELTETVASTAEAQREPNLLIQSYQEALAKSCGADKSPH